MATGHKHSEETKAKMRASAMGRKMSAEARAKMSAQRKGRPVSQETRNKLSATLKGKPKTKEHIEKVAAANRGKKKQPLTVEQRRKLSSVLKGRPRAPSVVARLRRGEMHPNWGVTPPHGRRVEYNGTTYRSSYEVRFVKALDALGIKWEYEPTRFDLGTCTYLPDFYLPDDGVYWEVKGWLGPDSQKKIARFREVNPDLPLIVATVRVIKTFERLASANT